jgi:hypothetical protein
MCKDKEFDVIIFGDKVILDEDVLKWPMCDFLISFTDREHFPLNKAIAYAKLRRPFCVNDIQMQTVLWDRRLCLRILSKLGVPTPERVEVNRDDGFANLSPETAQRIYLLTRVRLPGLGGGQVDVEPAPIEVHLEDDGDTLVVNGKRLSKPFVEKPASSKDHNVLLYYPKSQGGGCRLMSRKAKQSTYSEDNNSTVPRCIIEQDASFIYEKFLGLNKNAQDVTAYTAGSEFCYAEIRQSPMVNSVVERKENGREVTYETKLTMQEQVIAAKIATGFGQWLCRFNLLRFGNASYVIGVKGWSLAKDNNDFYDKCASMLKSMFVGEKQRRTGRIS